MVKTILAIDSSLACPAFAVCKVDPTGKKIKVVEVSHIKTNSKKTTGYRLFQIYNHVQDIFTRYTFDVVVFEKGFNRFAVATQQIQRTMGLLLFTIYRQGIENISEISPTSVKKYVTGNGKASKEELAHALVSYVGEIKYKTNDESDAVGVAIAFAKQENWL